MTRNVSLYKDIAKEHPEKLEEIIKDNSYYNMSKEVGISGKEVHGVVQYYFALIAMACLFGGYVGYTIGIQLPGKYKQGCYKEKYIIF